MIRPLFAVPDPTGSSILRPSAFKQEKHSIARRDFFFLVNMALNPKASDA